MTLRRSVWGLTFSGIILLVARSLAAPVAGERQSPSTLSTDIEALVAPQVEAELFSGVILVARGNRILFQQAYGYSDWELRAPNEENTRFGIASITKSMTQTLVRLLADAGRIELDAPVEQYLSGFPRGPEGGVPTVGDLMTHRAGVPHRVTEPMEESQALVAADIVARVQETGLLFEPGSQSLYSSAGYTCLARVIEVVEARAFESVLAERVFGPAGMTSATSETGPSLMARRAEQYRLGSNGRQVVVKNAPYKDLRFLTGAGSTYASAEDLLKFVQAIRAGVFGTGLAEEVFGGEQETWRGWTGRTNGYEASVDMLPSADLTFVLLSNLRSAANWQLREQIQNLVIGRSTAAVSLPPPVAEPFEAPESLVGSYGSVEISLTDGVMFRGDNEFYPIEGRQYYTPASGTMLRFRRDASGAVDAVVSIGAGGELTVIPRSNRPASAAPIHDDFNPAASLAQWNDFASIEGWPNRLDRLGVDSEAGVLVMEPKVGAWFWGGHGAYVYREIEGDFVAFTRVRVRGLEAARPSVPWSRGGLLLREPPDTDVDKLDRDERFIHIMQVEDPSQSGIYTSLNEPFTEEHAQSRSSNVQTHDRYAT